MIESRKFRHKKTGEIKTLIPLLEIGDYEEMKNERTIEKAKQEAKARGFNSMTELAKYRVAIKRQLSKQGVPFDYDADTDILERLNEVARDE